MPAFNEEGNIERAVRSALEVGRDLAPPCEVVVVDDGSHDGTGKILARLETELAGELTVVRLGDNRGYGAALRAGFAAARGQLVFYTDSDNQFDLRELDGFLEMIEHNDAVLDFRIDRQDPALRCFVSGVFNGLSSLVLGMSVRDLNCSFKLFRREVLEGLELVSNDFLIDTELVARVHRGGWRYVQKGVRHYPRTAGQSTVRPGDVPHTLASLARLHVELRSAHPSGTRALDPEPPTQS